MRWRLGDLEIFCAVVDAGGVTNAASRLDAPKSTVSKVLARLEHDLGLTLIERSSRRLRITDEGWAFHRQARLILDIAEDTDAMMQGLRAEPSGRVVLAAPPAFCREVLAPQLPRFARLYPRLRLDLVVTARPPDIGAGEIDMAVVVGPQPDSDMKQIALMGGRLIWVCSPAYAVEHGLDLLEAPEQRHIAIHETRYAAGPLHLHLNGQAMSLTVPEMAMRVNDPLCVREAVTGGLGVALLPERYCGAALARGDLVEVWPEARLDTGAARLAVIYPGSRLLAPRCRAVLAFLQEISRSRLCEPPITDFGRS